MRELGKEQSKGREVTHAGRKLNSRERNIGHTSYENLPQIPAALIQIHGPPNWGKQVIAVCEAMHNHIPFTMFLHKVVVKSNVFWTLRKSEIWSWSVVKIFCKQRHMLSITLLGVQ